MHDQKDARRRDHYAQNCEHGPDERFADPYRNGSWSGPCDEINQEREYGEYRCSRAKPSRKLTSPERLPTRHEYKSAELSVAPQVNPSQRTRNSSPRDPLTPLGRGTHFLKDDCREY